MCMFGWLDLLLIRKLYLQLIKRDRDSESVFWGFKLFCLSYLATEIDWQLTLVECGIHFIFVTLYFRVFYSWNTYLWTILIVCTMCVFQSVGLLWWLTFVMHCVGMMFDMSVHLYLLWLNLKCYWCRPLVLRNSINNQICDTHVYFPSVNVMQIIWFMFMHHACSSKTKICDI